MQFIVIVFIYLKPRIGRVREVFEEILVYVLCNAIHIISLMPEFRDAHFFAVILYLQTILGISHCAQRDIQDRIIKACPREYIN